MKKARYILIFLIITLFQFIFITTSLGAENINSSNLESENSSSSTQAQTKSSTSDYITIDSPSCVLIESSTEKILYKKNANEVRYPASTTKIMTAILVLENCELTDVATVSHNAIYSIPADYVTSNLREGEELTIEQLLNVLLIPSANDAAIVLAEHVSGSVEEFAKLMNEKAKEIGCKNTNFVNPNGIHNNEHVSTAYDLALMAQYAMQNSTFREIVKKTKYTLPVTNKYSKEDRTFTTTNDLLVKNTSNSKSNYYYPDAIGVKTGYTGEAGNCLVSAAKRGNMEVIAVVLGAGFTKEGLSEKFLDSITLLDYAFDNYSIKTIQEKNNVLQEVKVSGATKETENLKIAVKDDIQILVENNKNFEELQPEIILDKLNAPITIGTTVGTVTYTFDGKSYSSELVAKDDVIPSKFLPMLLHISLIIVTLYMIYLLLKSDKGNKKKEFTAKNRNKNSKSKKSNKRRKKGGKYRYTVMNNL